MATTSRLTAKRATLSAAALLSAALLSGCEPKQAAAVTSALKRMPGVRKLQSVSGPFDMIATVEAANVSVLPSPWNSP